MKKITFLSVLIIVVAIFAVNSEVQGQTDNNLNNKYSSGVLSLSNNIKGENTIFSLMILNQNLQMRIVK